MSAAGRSLLIVATEDDPHADAVIEALSAAGFDDVLRVDPSRADRAHQVEIRPAGPGAGWRIGDRSQPERFVDQTSLRAVYFRRVAPASEVGRLYEPDAATLDRSEVFYAVRWLVDALPETVFPFGHPVALLAAENKLRQLAIAAEVGFRLPATLYANQPALLADFAASHAEVAVKALANPVLGDGATVAPLRTATRPGAAIADALRARASAQLYLQARIAKRADLRLMVFPGRTLACEIETSVLGPAAIDWRSEIPSIPHRIVPVPAALDRQARDYLRRIGIGAGYFDFAVLDGGGHVFFECNPNAEWAWIQHWTGHPIAAEIAGELIAAAGRPATGPG